MLDFKKYLFKENRDEEELFELKDDIMLEIANMLLHSKPGEIIPWVLVPAARLKKIYQDYANYGIVRDYRGISNIRDIIVKNILKLYWCNAFNIHDSFNPIQELKYYNIYTKEQLKKIKDAIDDDYLSDKNGTWYVSDYGLPILLNLVGKLYKEENPEKILFYVDRVLNVVHRRNDLSSWFVEGGRKTLDDISNYGFHKDIRESIESELSKMEYYGNRIIERHDFGRYSIILSDAPWINVYQITLTSNDRDFITPKSQIKIPLAHDNVSLKEIFKTVKELKKVLLDWVKKYKPLYVCTYNHDRIYKYKSLLEKMGIYSSDIKKSDSRFSTGKAWYFEILSYSKPIRESKYSNIKKKLIYIYDDSKIYLVDGEEVRNKIYVDFTMGGHGYVYDFIPKDEIWIENLNSVFDKKCTIIHELIERHLMKKYEYNYEKAHAISTRIEQKIRNNKINENAEQLNLFYTTKQKNKELIELKNKQDLLKEKIRELNNKIKSINRIIKAKQSKYFRLQNKEPNLPNSKIIKTRYGDISIKEYNDLRDAEDRENLPKKIESLTKTKKEMENQKNEFERQVKEILDKIIHLEKTKSIN